MSKMIERKSNWLSRRKLERIDGLSLLKGSKRTMRSLWWRYIQHTFSTEETRCWKYAACYYVIPIPFPYLLATFELVSNFCSLRVRSVNCEWHTFITITFNVLYSTTILGSPVANNFSGNISKFPPVLANNTTIETILIVHGIYFFW